MGINRGSMNDGFYAYKVPQVVFSSYFIPPENLFKAMDVLAKSYKEHESSDTFEWKSAFMAVEKEWEKLGAKPHLGKFWGFEENDGRVEPYQPSQACKIYSEAQKATFNEYRQEVDPDGLFAGGSAMLLLAPCPPLV